MENTQMERTLHAEHGVVCRLPGERFGYFGWPTVARLNDSTLVVASSGLRAQHVGPWGKTVLHTSADEGRTWSEARVIQDSLIDDRDAGIVDLGDGGVLVSWFRSDTRQFLPVQDWMPPAWANGWEEEFATWGDAEVEVLLGSWVMLSDDTGATWGEPIRVPVTAPHGPIRLQGGDLLYFGKEILGPSDLDSGPISAVRSSDGGKTWKTVGSVPLRMGTAWWQYHEPHVLELPDGRLIGMIRSEAGEDAGDVVPFGMMQTRSDDGGRTWTTPEPLPFRGAPPHLLRHSSGILILSYSYRGPSGHRWRDPAAPDGDGQRVALSTDEGKTWDHDWIIRDDGPHFDLGYPSTVELPDGQLFTVYYQKVAAGEKCSLLSSRWKLPTCGRP
jgi:sialidase-1